MNENGYGINVVRDDGKEFSYENEDFKLITVEGIDFPEIEIFKEPKGFGDGDIITGKRELSRIISLSLAVNNFSQDIYKERRKRIVNFHDPKHSYDVHISYLGDTKIAKSCEIQNITYPTERFRSNSILNIEYLSPYSSLFSDTTIVQSFTKNTAMWHDTRTYLPGDIALPWDVVERSNERYVHYEGTTPATVIITIRATGYLSNILIEINNLSFLILTTLRENDVLIIDSDLKEIRKNGIRVGLNAYSQQTLTKAAIIPGDNHIKITDSSGSLEYIAELRYVGRFGGM